ncbi:CUB and sushi domain-containing protein, partial [Mytilus galloprovincialis]
CSIHEMATEGTIQSPGYIVGGYPENIECTWTIQRPTSETRTMALRFNKFDIQSQGDYLKVYNDTSEALHTGDGFTGTTDLTNSFDVRSTNGYIKLVFTTNYVLTDKGFEAEFSLDCQKFAVSPETHFISKSKYKTTFGNIVDFSCDEGYSFVNEGHSNNISIRCQKGGEWNKPRIPNCIVTYCPIPPAVDNGYIVESSGVKVGNNVTYKCNDGFTMNGEPVIKCLQDGNWEDEPKCTASRCVSLSKPIHGTIKILTGDGRDFASVVQYVCDPGYETYGHVTTYCQTGGKWSHVPPSCERIWCPIPRTPNGNWYPRNAQKFEGTITLTCDRGFHINGTNTRVMVLKCESGGHFLPDVTCFSNTGYHLTCPLNKTIYIHSAAGEIFNVSDVVYVTPSDSDLTFTYSPEELLTFDYTSMVEQKKVVVTATYKSETEYQCSFFVETKADACFKESFPVSVPNAAPVTCTSGNISCTVSCNSGYVFFDGNTTKTYDCTGQNMWMPALPPDTCIKYDEPSYIIELQVVYNSYGHFAKDCKAGHEDKIRTNNASLMNEIFNTCNNAFVSAGPVVITKTQTTTTGFDYRTSFTIKLLSTGLSKISDKYTCTLLLENSLDKDDFLDYTGIVQCNYGSTATIVRLTSDYSNKMITSGNQCDNGIKKMTTIDSSQKCIPCPPGTYSGNNDECNVCPDGKFQNNFGQDECLECPSDNPVPSEDKTTCLAVCPAGFIFVDGLPTCMPCPEDRFWVNKTYCQPCPGCGNTAGKNAISDINGCKDTTVHQLTCPLNKTINIHTAAGKVFNVSDVVSVTPSDSKLKLNFSPAESITLDHTAMIEQKKVVVTATGTWGAEDQCSFFVETKAVACFRESFPVSVSNAAPVTCTSSNISCTVTCNSGFVFFDGNQTKIYDCTGQNMWLPALPPDTCISMFGIIVGAVVLVGVAVAVAWLVFRCWRRRKKRNIRFEEYRAVRDHILQNNRSATVIAIECLYFSIYRWNQSRGFNYNTQTTQLYKDIDLKLKSAINYNNQQLYYFNRNILAPHISQDQIISSKQRKQSRTQNTISFKSVFNGIHPRRPISRLWIHRMVILARNLRNLQ